MKSRPILFSGPMVRAILEGRKTMTRRIVKPQPLTDIVHGAADDWFSTSSNQQWTYFQPGDHLWVKETWRMASNLDHYAPSRIPDYERYRENVRYLADGDQDLSGRTRVSIHMPRWASRITLEVTGIRVERLQDITEAEAQHEGILRNAVAVGHIPTALNMGVCRYGFANLWETLNGPDSWNSNPWVWVIEFRKL